MTAMHAGISGALPDIVPAQAEYAHELGRALGRRLGPGGFDIAIRSVSGTEGGWYLGPHFAFRPAAPHAAPIGADAVRLQQALAAQTTLLDRVENATGLAAEFVDYGVLGQDRASTLLSRDGQVLADIVALTAIPQAPPAQLRERLQLECIVAQLSMEDAASTGPGDIIVLPSGAWQMSGAATGSAIANCWFDPRSGRIGGKMTGTAAQTRGHSMTDRKGSDSFTVAVSIALPNTTVTAEELDRLARGGTMELSPVSEGLNVTLSVGGRALGQGELIRLGDRFAVLIDEPAGADRDESDESDPSPASASPDTDPRAEDDF